MDVVLKNKNIDKIFEKFLKNHKKFDYDKCLRRNCPVPKSTSHSFNERSQVLNFLRLILYQVVPRELFGSGKNQRIMYHNLKKLVFAGKFDKFCLGQFMMKIRVKDCEWIGKDDGISLREKIVSKMLLWLVTDYFMIILKSYFYVTDTSFGCHQLFYYRQSKWRKLCKVKIDELIESGVFRRIENKDLIEKLKNEGYGVGNLRFTPKVSNLRPLVSQTKQKESDLEKLRYVLCTLKYAIRKNPSLIGFGSQSVRTARQKWGQFKKSAAGNSKYYFVRVDVKDCFHSMIQKKLLEILEKVYDYLFRSNSYVRIAEVDHFRRLRTSVFRHRVLIAGDARDSFEEMLDGNQAAFVGENVVLDSGKRFIMTKPCMRSRLKRYICSLLCTLPASACGNEQPPFHQIQGIVQGQMLSSILCNIYYGAMDNQHLSKYTKNSGNFLIRLIDDYLFVSPNIDEANQFLAQMVAGFDDFNSQINSSKCCTNLRESGDVFPEIQTIRDDTRMPWLGSQIDVTSLDIFIDYSRYGNIETDSTIARQFWKSSMFMKEKVLNSLKSKSSESIYFDESCNSIKCVTQNVYELFLIAAFRLVCYIRFSGRKKGADYIFDIIRTCSDSVFKILRRLKKKTSLTKFEVRYLSLRAFERKFMTLLTWRQLGRKLRFRRLKLLEKTRKTIVDTIDTFPKDFSNFY
uniref:Telomerase reverse transcriptase n=1 Tax=Strigamia maritima TaxID=126957 RepID=T1J3Z4_STRMM